MKLCCIYWTLLLISFTSSCLLFLIVASESTNNHVLKKVDDKEVISNVTISETSKNDGRGIQDDLNNKIKSKSSELVTENPQDSQKTDYGCSDNSDTIETQYDEKSSPNIFEESLTQQPNLSQGISETGQAVVLTLVDTASVELQNLAEPHISSSDIQSKSATNLTLSSPHPLETDTLTHTNTLVSQLPRLRSIPIVVLSTESLNETQVKSSDVSTKKPHDDNKNIIDIIQTEDKISQDNKNQILDNLNNDENIKSTENSQILSSGEFDDITSRGKFVNTEDTAAVILDGIISTGGSDKHEDIPSFSEWAQKRLEEAEKKKTHPNASIQNPGNPGKGIGSLKVRSKNYASPDCGAKIVAVNPEARSARSVLVSTRDEYMLNTCTSRVWFVVELCEAIQAKKIELANFELFSSSPKDFSVFVSDRFPTRDWSPVGQFTAQDERDIQSFTLHPHLFGKFIKIELHSHYGSEHFCPISLFRAYGTSEFEVLETETEVQETSDDNDDDDDDDENLFENDTNDSSRNLFGSARDVVIRIVKKAAEVLVKNDDSNKNNKSDIQKNMNNDNKQNLFDNCMTPRYTIICNNCTNNISTKVYKLISCHFNYLDKIIKLPFVNNTIYKAKLCDYHGILINNKKSSIGNSLKNNTQSLTFFTSIYSPEYVIAFCNILIIKEYKILLNLTKEETFNMLDSTSSIHLNLSNSNKVTETITSQVTINCNSDTDALNCRHLSTSKDSKIIQLDSTKTDESSSIGLIKDTKKSNTIENIASTTIIGTQIRPSKTLTKNEVKRESSIPNLEPSKDPVEETSQADVLTTPSPLINLATATLKVIEEPIIFGTPTETIPQVPSQIPSQHIVEIFESTSVDLNNKIDVGLNQKIDHSSIKQEDKKEKLKESDDIGPQEQLNEDILFSDLRELENGDTIIQGLPNNPSTITQPTASSTPQQKESVFLRLSNRIKALERNMSLSGQYLEELSKRYKKQVEEMQKSLERTTTTMSDEFKKNEEREIKRLEEISLLREELSLLSESMEIILYEHNSWGSKLSTFGQHIIFIFVEIVVLVLIITYCRRSNETDDVVIKNRPLKNKEITRRKSAESISCINNKNKENKKRRPSEIASRISGNYRGLMIDERTETRRDRKKKRKRESLMRLGSNIETKREQIIIDLPSRRSLSVDNPNYRQIEEDLIKKKPDSVPDCDYNFLDKNKNNDDFQIETISSNKILIDEIDGLNSSDLVIDNFINRLCVDSKNPIDDNNLKCDSPRGLSILKNSKLYSPSFIRTALKSRSKRIINDKSNDNSNSPSSKNKLNKWEWYSKSSGGSKSDQDSSSVNLNNSLEFSSVNNSQNGENHNYVSEDSESSSTTPTHGKKDKKEGGLRKMVRRFF